MLHQMTDAALADKSAYLRTQVAELSQFISRTAKARADRIAELVAVYLPNLSRTGLKRLNVAYPKFLANVELAELYRKNIPTLGVFMRVGYAKAFALIQAQFRAYLNTCGALNWFDGALRDAEQRKTELTREFVAVESERHRRRAAPVTRAVEVTDLAEDLAEVATAGSLRTNIIGLALLDDNSPVTAVAQAAELAVRQECIPAEDRPCIETDDRLGYFS